MQLQIRLEVSKICWCRRYRNIYLWGREIGFTMTSTANVKIFQSLHYDSIELPRCGLVSDRPLAKFSFELRSPIILCNCMIQLMALIYLPWISISYLFYAYFTCSSDVKKIVCRKVAAICFLSLPQILVTKRTAMNTLPGTVPVCSPLYHFLSFFDQP